MGEEKTSYSGLFSFFRKGERCYREAQSKDWKIRILNLTLLRFPWYTDLKLSAPQFPLIQNEGNTDLPHRDVVRANSALF